MISLDALNAEGFGVFKARQEVNLRRAGRVIILGQNDDTASADSNGSGKTTIFKALTWGLFGRTVDGLTTDVVHRGAKKATVEVSFVVEDGSAEPPLYMVTRTRTAKSGRLKLERVSPEPEDLTQRGAKNTQKAIERLLGSDFTAFCSTCLFGQGDHSRFASRALRDAARKAVLGKVLGLDRYDTARESARSELSVRKKALADLHTKMDELERSKTRAEAEAARAEGVLAGLGDPKELLEEANEHIIEAKAEHERVNDAVDKLVKLNAEQAEVEAEVEDLQGKAKKVFALYDRAVSAVARASSLHESACHEGGGTCEACGQERPKHPTDPELKAARAAELAAAKEHLSRVRGLRDGCAEDLAGAREDLAAIKSDVRAERSRKEAAERARRQNEARAASLRGAADSLADDRSAAEADRANALADMEVCDSLIADLPIGDAERAISIADWWAKRGFGPKGVPSLAIEQSLPVINTRANGHLLTLTDGDIQVRWSATTTGSSGTVKEELTQELTIEGVEDSVPSGGQQKKVELATELALAEMMREGEGLGVDAVLLDEALDGLDAEGQARVCAWLEGLGASSTFVISHDPAIAESFDRALLVRKSGGAATIQEA